MKKIGFLFTLALFIGLSSCEEEVEYTYENGTYKAEAADYHYGWKAFIEAEIKNDELVSVDFDYLDEDGNRKSETTQEDYNMDPHPSVWCPEYESMLMAADILNFAEVDKVTGATGGQENVNELFLLILDAALEGDTSTQIASAE